MKLLICILTMMVGLICYAEDSSTNAGDSTTYDGDPSNGSAIPNNNNTSSSLKDTRTGEIHKENLPIDPNLCTKCDVEKQFQSTLSKETKASGGSGNSNTSAEKNSKGQNVNQAQ